MANDLTLTAPPAVFQQRRAKLAQALARPLVIFAGHAPSRTYPANTFPFRPASTYTYFGGPPVEQAALIIEPDSDGDDGVTLLRPPPDPDDVLWSGPAPTDEALCAAAGLRAAGLNDLTQLDMLVAGHEVPAIVPARPRTTALARELDLVEPTADEQLAIINLRLCKDEHELAAMRKAAAISIEAHRAAMTAARPGRREADAAAAYTAVLVKHGADHAFNPIITVRGEVLHGHGHANELGAGQLLLIDAGAEEPGGYACDITRTLPVDGQWTPVQRHLYDTVLRAQQAAIAACVPQRRYRDVHDLAARVLCEGLVQAELLKGDPAELAGRFAHTLFFPHGVGHLIGLDAHDMEDFGDLAGYAPGRSRRPEFGNAALRLDRDLAPGMCVTIEPGIYIVPAFWERDELVRPFADVVNRAKVDALLADQFGGIRIEETLCVRDAQGPEALTAELPNDADTVATLAG